MTAKILLVEDDRALREALADTLQIGGHAYRAVDCAEAAVLALAEEPFSLVLSDVNMPGMDGHQLLALIRARYPHLPVLLMTAFAAVERAVDAMRQGAADYLVKPFEPKSLLDLVARHALGRPATSDTDGPVALEPASRQLLELAGRVAKSDSTVLISGESGTGKEVLARYIHQQSPRAGKPFIAINCAAIPDNMLEAILFGHEKGAFTGAIAAQPGKFELADGGTILLDEVSELPLGLQAKLLRVLQEHEVERVGARKPIVLDIRVLATSNRDLVAEVAAGRFREDLFYRLSVFPLGWQPLRERTADILPLAERLLNKYAKKMQHAAVRLSPQAQACLIGYPWPGNVRELDNAIQRALILQQGGLIQPQDLCLSAPLGITPNGQAAVGFAAQPVGGAASGVAAAGMAGSAVTGSASTQSAVPVAESARWSAGAVPVAGQAAASAATSAAWPGAAVGGSAAESGQALPLGDAGKVEAVGGLGDDLRRHEFQMIIDTLRTERGRRKESAERLGISPRTLRYKLAQMRDAGMDVEGSLFAS